MNIYSYNVCFFSTKQYKTLISKINGSFLKFSVKQNVWQLLEKRWNSNSFTDFMYKYTEKCIDLSIFLRYYDTLYFFCVFSQISTLNLCFFTKGKCKENFTYIVYNVSICIHLYMYTRIHAYLHTCIQLMLLYTTWCDVYLYTIWCIAWLYACIQSMYCTQCIELYAICVFVYRKISRL